MKLKRFETDNFAGITNKEISFKDGLNVILGANEAGKSTLIEAIFATIFKDAKLRMNLGADKEFKERFMPYPDGDYINGRLEFESDGQNYKLEKEWGDTHSTVLELSDGKIFKNSNKIEGILKELFTFGQATYGNIVFARQRDVKEAVERIISDKSITNTVSLFLRKAVMELEGISVERLRNKIDEEINNLTKRWDLSNNRPENPNRDIHNPFKVGYGKIYAAYLMMAGNELKMKKAEEIEGKFEEISSELKELEKNREILMLEIDKMAKLEDDIFKRGSLEPEIKRLEEKSAALKKINSQWPLKEDELKRKRRELEELDKLIESLKKEKLEARKKLDIEKDRTLLKRIEKLKEKIEKKKEEQNKVQKFKPELISKIESLDSITKKNEAFLQASTLIAKINKAEDKVLITRGVEDRETVSPGDEVKANAYLHLEIEDKYDIEIQSEGINFKELKVEYQESKSKLNKILVDLKVDNISAAKLAREKYINIENEIRNYKEQIENLLDGRVYSTLKEKTESLASIETVRSLDEIEDELEEKNKDRADLIAAGRSLRDQVKNWQEEYSEADNLLDKLVEIKVELKDYKKQLSELVELPEKFENADEFKKHLNSLRDNKEKLDEISRKKREELLNITAELPDVSYEELEILEKEYKRKYQSLVKRANDLLKTKEVVEEKLEELDRNTFTPLLKSFNKYLYILTTGNYQLGEIHEDFQIEIKDSDKKGLPVNISFLSYGTYDGVALAFRFALIEQLFGKDSFIILDDCLVNLDPERKNEAIKLINKFALDYQLVFTTCNPETARELGGNLIEISS